MDKALELWKRLFEFVDDPYVDWYCFFCGRPEGMFHQPNCIWIEAKKLVEENKDVVS